MRSLDVRFSGYAQNRKEAQIVRRVSKKETAVKNGRCGNQEEKGLHKPFIGIPVTMAKGSHLFPYRTQKLSLSAPMVLGWRRPGRVGHCRIPYEKSSALAGLFSYSIRKSPNFRTASVQCFFRTSACKFFQLFLDCLFV